MGNIVAILPKPSIDRWGHRTVVFDFSHYDQKRPLDFGKSTRRYTVQFLPSYPTQNTRPQQNTRGTVSEMQSGIKIDEDYIQIPCSVSAEDVRRSLNGIKNPAPRQNGIHYTNLKHLSIVTTRHFAKIYETWLKLKYFPTFGKRVLLPYHQNRTKISGTRKTSTLSPFSQHLAKLSKGQSALGLNITQKKTTFYFIASQVLDPTALLRISS